MPSFSVDARTKLFLVVFSAITVFAFYSTVLEIALVGLIAVLGACLGRAQDEVRMVALYALLTLLQQMLLPFLSDSMLTICAMFVVSFKRLIPCVMAGMLLIRTTRVSELMSSLYRMRFPKSVVIPLAVTMRYVPAIGEEWRCINEAMRIRGSIFKGVGVLKRVLKSAEIPYIPLLASASQIADELSAAAVTKGIEDPAPRTILRKSSFSLADCLVLAYLAATLAAVALLQAGGSL